MSSEIIEQVVAEFIERRSGRRGVSRTVHLFDTGVISSLFLIELLSFLRSRFGTRIPVEDLDLEAFSTIEQIAKIAEASEGKR